MGKKSTSEKFFSKHSRLVEEYLAGERENPKICTNRSIARRLEKTYNIEMVEVEPVNRSVGLYMFEIQ